MIVSSSIITSTLILILTQFLPALSVSPDTRTITPIKHLIIIFQENVSFDHYFATYPHAANIPGEPSFTPTLGTAAANVLTKNLLTKNLNLANPFRLDRSEFMTCDMYHKYYLEQKAYDAGKVDKFVQFTGSKGGNCNPNQVMGYYDGNTVTAIWNYASHFSLNDNSYGTTFGPSTVGALNLISGQTHGAMLANIRGSVVNGTVIDDPNPAFDDCSRGITIAMQGKNIGDLLNSKQITWGWFQGGFRPTSTSIHGNAVCGSTHKNMAGNKVTDYISHHEPFQYYESTSNPHHFPPTSLEMIGRTDVANHQYDLNDFWQAIKAGNLPEVSFLKASGYQDGHPGYSDPLDEQTFLVNTINTLQKLPEWNNTAVIIAYDDSDGWYDHVMPPNERQSNDPMNDGLFGKGICGHSSSVSYQDRCGYGPRLPMIIVSPWAKLNFVDHNLTDQTSILRFIEDNWGLGRVGNQSFDADAGSLQNMFDFKTEHNPRLLILNPSTGTPG
jgi:phospholipase C